MHYKALMNEATVSDYQFNITFAEWKMDSKLVFSPFFLAAAAKPDNICVTIHCKGKLYMFRSNHCVCTSKL